jgi:hypothetical protein
MIFSEWKWWYKNDRKHTRMTKKNENISLSFQYIFIVILISSLLFWYLHYYSAIFIFILISPLSLLYIIINIILKSLSSYICFYIKIHKQILHKTINVEISTCFYPFWFRGAFVWMNTKSLQLKIKNRKIITSAII